MAISVFDLFSIGIGPSSSHTVGPMRAARRFLLELQGRLREVAKIKISLHGSLAFTCRGHGTDKALIMGLLGEQPDKIQPETIRPTLDEIFHRQKISLLNQHEIPFNPLVDIKLVYDCLLPHHSNGMLFQAFAADESVISEQTIYSIGGGFIVTTAEIENPAATSTVTLPFPFDSADELLKHCEKQNCAISDIMLANEKVWRSEKEIHDGLINIANVMEESLNRGCQTDGELAGGLRVRRRAASLYRRLIQQGPPSRNHPELMNWLNLFAMAVNEENAAGNRVVTAPTNGAAGIIPAVLNYYKYFSSSPTPEGVVNFLLTAGAVGILYKKNASISGAEMGCQGEVGVACSMAAGGLAAVLGGSIYQVENAAEIGMEHNLGLTCDPVMGLVQIPCIERNAIGAVKAVNAAQLALAEDGRHIVSLDMVINTMREIGRNMNTIYKETSKGGLAVNVPEC